MKNFVMGAEIDPKVVMDLSIFKIGGWNSIQPSNQQLSDECIDENKPRLSIRILSGGSFFTIQYLELQFMCDDPNMKESRWHSRLFTLFWEDLHELMQCYERQHFVASNDLHQHPRRLSSWKDSMKMKYSKMRSKSSVYTWNAKAIMIHLDSYEVCERNGMSPDMHTTWWNVKMWRSMEIILIVLREQSEGDTQLANFMPETLREWEPTLKERQGLWE